MKNFTFLEVTDKELLDKVYEFRYRVFKEIYPKYIQSLNLKATKEYDKYDKYSVHFVALSEVGDVCATMRIVYNSPIGYPTEKYTKFDNSMFEREKLGEMSRIFIDKEYRNIKTSKIIMDGFKKLTYFKMLDLGIKYTYGYLEESFLRLLQIYKIPYQAIGVKQEKSGFGERYPCIMYRDKLGQANSQLLNIEEYK